MKLHWEKQLKKKDLSPVEQYLRLIFEPKDVRSALSEFEKNRSSIERFMARDILRASQNQLLPESNEDVRDQFVKIFEGEPLVPIALVRKNEKLFIADGFHRMCAAYYLDKECEIHSVLVGI